MNKQDDLAQKLQPLIDWADENRISEYTIPNEIEKLSKLQALDISCCRCCCLFTEISDSIRYLSELRYLNIFR